MDKSCYKYAKSVYGAINDSNSVVFETSDSVKYEVALQMKNFIDELLKYMLEECQQVQEQLKSQKLQQQQLINQQLQCNQIKKQKQRLLQQERGQIQERALQEQAQMQLEMQAQQLKLQQKSLVLQEKQMKNTARCPRCGCTSLSGNKKGFGIGKAVIGAAIAGPIGLVAGNIHAKKVRVTCMKCGKTFMA